MGWGKTAAMELCSEAGVDVACKLHSGDLPMNRNVLILAVAVLCVAVGALGYKLYEEQREPKGVQLNIGSNGISVEKK